MTTLRKGRSSRNRSNHPSTAPLIPTAIECPHATPAPQRHQPFAIGPPQFRGRLNQNSANDSAIILPSVDQPGLLDHKAEHDSTQPPLAPLPDPGASAVTSPHHLTTMTHLRSQPAPSNVAH